VAATCVGSSVVGRCGCREVMGTVGPEAVVVGWASIERVGSWAGLVGSAGLEAYLRIFFFKGHSSAKA